MSRKKLSLAFVALLSVALAALAIGLYSSGRLSTAAPTEVKATADGVEETSAATRSFSTYEAKYYSVGQVMQLIDNGTDLTIVNVDPPESFEAGHIKGAISLPIDEIDQRYKELDPNKLVLLYCG